MARRLANKGRRSIPRTTVLGKKRYDSVSEKINAYQKNIKDPDYLDFAIDKIAQELTHFLMK